MPPRPQMNHSPSQTAADHHDNNDKSAESRTAATLEFGRSPTLLKAVPSSFPSPLPWHYQILANTSAMVVPGLFYAGPLLWASTLTLPLAAWMFFGASHDREIIQYGVGWCLFIAVLTFVPVRKWPYIRQFFQLWYERYDFHHNLLPTRGTKGATINTTTTTTTTNDNPSTSSTTFDEDKAMTIYATHPHGIIPIHGYLWCALCDQIMPQRYGVGALTDVAMRLPLLRHVMTWLSSTHATKKNLLRHMRQGTNLWILPGGVAEIFLSQRLADNHNGDKRYPHVIQTPRRSLMKLALETGALLVPCYAFGATDFYHQLATYKQGSSKNDNDNNNNHQNTDPTNVLGKLQCYLSRKLQGGLTFFWGVYGTTLPYPVKCTYVVGDPIEPVVGTLGQDDMGGQQTCQKVPHPSAAQIDELHQRYSRALLDLFEQYKVQAGHANAELVFQS